MRHKILIVEDNAINLDLITAMLEPFDLDIIAAEDGYEALKKTDENPDISLILLDIGLPGIDGTEVFKRLKCIEASKDIPIIAVTAHAMAGNKEHLMSLGFNDFVAKPIDKKILYEKIREYLKLGR
ncbi:MAG: response regulator [Deltaproteobacteria bacterium]|nr:response regulator [Deltaproteobacteria bacterium]